MVTDDNSLKVLFNNRGMAATRALQNGLHFDFLNPTAASTAELASIDAAEAYDTAMADAALVMANAGADSDQCPDRCPGHPPVFLLRPDVRAIHLARPWR